MVGIFISYRREDSADVTGRIRDRLESTFGREAIFTDVDSIPLGIDFKAYITDRVGRCECLLPVIGPRWLNVTDSNNVGDWTTHATLCERKSKVPWREMCR